MMLLSRFWYVVLSLVLVAALYVVFLAVGQYDRRNSVAMNEGLASDSQVVGWQLQIDSRRRLDALLIGAVDKGVQDALVGANGHEPMPRPARDAAKRALTTIAEKLPADYKEDALFAVDRDGRVVGQFGFDMATEDMELGGYPAVFDALHGYLRDDTWVFGGKMYRVVARPVEFDVTQAPAGAIVGLKGVDPTFAKDISHRTRTNVAFFANGQRVASAIQEGFDSAAMDQVGTKLGDLATDKAYADTGHSEVHDLSDTVGAMYGRLYGDAWDLGTGYAVARARVAIAGPMGFITGADDKDKANVNWLLLIGALLGGAGLGIFFTFIEHTVAVKEIARQAIGLKKGEIDFFQLPRIRGEFRTIAQNVNAGMERVAEKGGAGRRPADLEQILGPVPVQPAMSAFALPGHGQDASQPGAPPPQPPRPAAPSSSNNSSNSGARPMPGPPPPFFPQPASASPFNVQTPVAQLQAAAHASSARASGSHASGAMPAPAGPPPRAMPQAPPARPAPAPAAIQRPPPAPPPPPMTGGEDAEDEEATMVAAIPAEVLAAATGEHKASEDTAEWMSVYEDFIRTKKQCGEPTDGLTFDKFQHTLKKNRDALIARHHCRRVRFSVYVKEGRASLKATPVKD